MKTSASGFRKFLATTISTTVELKAPVFTINYIHSINMKPTVCRLNIIYTRTKVIHWHRLVFVCVLRRLQSLESPVVRPSAELSSQRGKSLAFLGIPDFPHGQKNPFAYVGRGCLASSLTLQQHSAGAPSRDTRLDSKWQVEIWAVKYSLTVGVCQMPLPALLPK